MAKDKNFFQVQGILFSIIHLNDKVATLQSNSPCRPHQDLLFLSGWPDKDAEKAPICEEFLTGGGKIVSHKDRDALSFISSGRKPIDKNNFGNIDSASKVKG